MHNLTGLLMQMEQMELKIGAKLLSLQDQVIFGCSEDGLINVSGDIWFNIKAITIDRKKLSAKLFDLETLEKLIVQAINKTRDNTRNLLRTEIGKILNENIPSELGKFFGENETNYE